MSPFAAYICFFALKNHFTSSYNYFKYKGKLRRKQETFEKRKDKYLFEKLAKRIDVKDFLLANLSFDPKLWITDIVGSDEAEHRYIKWKLRIQSLSYLFGQELEAFPDDFYENGWKGQRAGIINAYLCEDISLETVCILLDLTKDRYEETIESNPVWREVIERVNNYTPFLKYEKIQFSAIAYRKFSHRLFLPEPK